MSISWHKETAVLPGFYPPQQVYRQESSTSCLLFSKLNKPKSPSLLWKKDSQLPKSQATGSGRFQMASLRCYPPKLTPFLLWAQPHRDCSDHWGPSLRATQDKPRLSTQKHLDVSQCSACGLQLLQGTKFPPVFQLKPMPGGRKQSSPRTPLTLNISKQEQEWGRVPRQLLCKR